MTLTFFIQGLLKALVLKHVTTKFGRKVACGAKFDRKITSTTGHHVYFKPILQA